MVTISEIDLSVFISLLAARMREMTDELAALKAREGKPTDDETDRRLDLQDALERYSSMLHKLRDEYEEALRAGIDLPTFEDLTGDIDGADSEGSLLSS